MTYILLHSPVFLHTSVRPARGTETCLQFPKAGFTYIYGTCRAIVGQVARANCSPAQGKSLKQQLLPCLGELPEGVRGIVTPPACSCRLHKINLFEYLSDVLNRVAAIARPLLHRHETHRSAAGGGEVQGQGIRAGDGHGSDGVGIGIRFP